MLLFGKLVRKRKRTSEPLEILVWLEEGSPLRKNEPDVGTKKINPIQMGLRRVSRGQVGHIREYKSNKNHVSALNEQTQTQYILQTLSGYWHHCIKINIQPTIKNDN